MLFSSTLTINTCLEQMRLLFRIIILNLLWKCCNNAGEFCFCFEIQKQAMRFKSKSVLNDKVNAFQLNTFAYNCTGTAIIIALFNIYFRNRTNVE